MSVIQKHIGTKRLFGKFMLVLLPVFTVSTTIGLLLISQYFVRDEQNLQNARLGNLVARVGYLISKEPNYSDQKLIESYLGILMADQAIRCVELLEKNELTQAVVPHRIGCKGQELFNFMSWRMPGKDSLQIRVRYTNEGLAVIRHDKRLFMELSLVIGVFFAVIASWLGFRNIVGRPLRSLLEAIKNTEASDLKSTILDPPNDELGAVMHAFNNMQRRLADEIESGNEAQKDSELFKDLNHQVTVLNMELENRIQELKAAQEEIVSKGKMAQLGQLTATVAHELRNPLSVVRTGAYMVKRGLSASGVNLDKHLTRIDSGVLRCDNIISQLLDFARVNKPDLAVTHVDDWLAAAIEEEATKLPSAIEVKCTLGLEDLKVAFDADRMRRVITNILSNASEAMVGKDGMRAVAQTHSPTIQVATRLQPHGVEIIITDNGPGMSDEVLAKIRDPLFTTKSFGTGLGLPAVEQVLKLHGGGLDIWSRPGEGARFTAWFPVVHEESEAA